MRKVKILGFSVAVLLICMVSWGIVYATTTDQTETQIDATEKQEEGIKELGKAEFISVAATHKGTIELNWEKAANANQYEVYRKEKGKGEYQLLATTKKTKYVDKSGQVHVTYVYQIRPIMTDAQKEIIGIGEKSQAVKCKVRKKNPKVAYAGDSIMTGFSVYNVLKGKKNARVFAGVGLNTGSFASSKEMKSLLKYNPDRLYIMLGVNSLWSTDSKRLNSMWSQYEKILKKCHKKNPNMEIIVVGVAPVGKGAKISQKAVTKFNKLLKKKVSKKADMYYCDISESMSNAKGYLLPEYGAGDGIHWKSSTYRHVLKQWDNFAKKIYWYEQ